MFRLTKILMNPLRFFQCRSWPQSTAVPELLEKNHPLEEENTPYYDTKRFYPTRIGEVLNDRYQITTKLGYGTSSTVWLARDLYQWRWLRDRYLAIKINAADRPGQRRAENELEITKAVSKANPQHHGWHFVRRLADSFILQGPYAQHICLVFEPLREPLWLVKTRFRGNLIPSEILKVILQMVLHGLDYLHSECHVIHTDLKPDNVMARLEDNSILEKSALDELENPLPRKDCDDRAIYLSRNQYGQPRDIARVLGKVTITDFGYAVRGDGPHYGPIQVEPFRAPEVILDAGWSYSSDIWNLGVMLWGLLEPRSLFDPVHPGNGEYDDQTHLAQITALLGPAPRELLERGKRTSMFYGPSGQFEPPISVPAMSFENSISQISGEEKRRFISFVKKMLTWKPTDRRTAKELLDDPWLYTEFPQEDSE